MTASNEAAPELEAVEVEGVTRSAFILKGALAAGAVYGASTVAPFVGQALAAGGGGDVAILQFALTLEHLETAFYKKALKLNLSGTAKTLATQFESDESKHVAALEQAIKGAGSKPQKAPTFKFPIKDEKSFLKVAAALEDTGVGAYNGAGPMIKNKKILAAAGSIVQIEGRHAGLIRLVGGMMPTMGAFDKGIPAAQVMTKIKPFVG